MREEVLRMDDNNTMTSAENHYEVYLSFIESLGNFNDSKQFIPLDSMEIELLNQIALGWRKNHPLLVNEAIALGHIGSRATLHSRIKSLREKGYVDFHNDIDGRKKIIKPSTLAIDYFSRIANLLTHSVARVKGNEIALA